MKGFLLVILITSGIYTSLYGYAQQDSSKYQFGISLSISHHIVNKTFSTSDFASRYATPFKGSVQISRTFNRRRTNIGLGVGIQRNRASYQIMIDGDLLGLSNTLTREHDYTFNELSLYVRMATQIYRFKQNGAIRLFSQVQICRHSVFIDGITYFSPSQEKVAMLQISNGGISTYSLLEVGFIIDVLRLRSLHFSPFVSYTVDLTPGNQFGGDYNTIRPVQTTNFSYPFNYINTGFLILF